MVWFVFHWFSQRRTNPLRTEGLVEPASPWISLPKVQAPRVAGAIGVGQVPVQVVRKQSSTTETSVMKSSFAVADGARRDRLEQPRIALGVGAGAGRSSRGRERQRAGGDRDQGDP